MDDRVLVQRVQRVLDVLEKADVPEDLRAVAFDCVWNAVLADAVPVTDDASDSLSGAGVKTDLSGLAAKLGVEVELAAEVFDQQEDGSISVQFPTSKLANTKLDATRELALLVCAARQCAQEQWTGGDVIRTVCQDYGKFDSPTTHQLWPVVIGTG